MFIQLGSYHGTRARARPAPSENALHERLETMGRSSSPAPLATDAGSADAAAPSATRAAAAVAGGHCPIARRTAQSTAKATIARSRTTAFLVRGSIRAARPIPASGAAMAA